MSLTTFQPIKRFSSLPFEVSNNYDNYEKLILNKEKDFKSRLIHYLEFSLACYQLKMISSRKTYNYKENGNESQFIHFNDWFIDIINEKLKKKDEKFYNYLQNVFDESGFKGMINASILKIIYEKTNSNNSKLIQLFVFKNWDSNLVFYTTLMFYVIFLYDLFIGFGYSDWGDNRNLLDMFLILSIIPVIGYYAAHNMDSE